MDMNNIIHGDCLEVMRGMEAETVDIVVTSPPYNLKAGHGTPSLTWTKAPLAGGYDQHGDAMPHEEYVAWQRDCLTEMYRLIRPHGAIWYNHQWRQQGGLLQDRADIMDGFPVRQIIIWSRMSTMFQCASQFLPPSYQVIYLVPKPDFRITPQGRKYLDVWNLYHARNNPHPAPFPVEIPQRCILSTAGADVVLDPFMGSGTTAVAAEKCDRQWIGIEQSGKYCDMANKRLAEHRSRLTLDLYGAQKAS